MEGRVLAQMLEQHVIVIAISLSLVRGGGGVLVRAREGRAQDVSQIPKMLEVLDSALGSFIRAGRELEHLGDEIASLVFRVEVVHDEWVRQSLSEIPVALHRSVLLPCLLECLAQEIREVLLLEQILQVLYRRRICGQQLSQMGVFHETPRPLHL